MTLESLVRFRNGKSIKPGGSGAYPVYGSNGTIGASDEYMYEDAIVLGRVGAYCGSVERCSGKFWASDNTIVVEANDDEVSLRFLYYMLIDANLNRHAGGAAQPLLTQSRLKPLEFNVPSLVVQRRIASILSAYDDLIENNTRRIAILEEMARRLYEEWFVHFRFPGHEDATFIDTEDGRVPEGWDVVRLNQAVEINPRTKVPKDGEKLFVPMGALSETGMNIAAAEYKTGNSGAKFMNGDTLVARITPCLENGKTGFVDFLPQEQPTACGSTEFIVLRSRTLCPQYVYLLARSNRFRDVAIKSMSGATGRQRVRTEAIQELMIVQPSTPCLERFEHTVAPLFKLTRSLTRKNRNLRAQRDLLLPKLISGEIDVSKAEEVVGGEAA